jgi:hypothetical protein
VRRSSRLLLVVPALAAACTPLRPLDGVSDAGRPLIDAAGLDAPGLDAFSPPLPDAFVAGADAWAPDAFVPGLDAWAPDGFSPPPDAWAPDAFVEPDGGLSDLIAWYPFDGARDATGNGHDLTFEGVMPAGTVLSVATGDRVYTRYRPDLDGMRAASLWVRTDARPTLVENRAGLVDHDAMFGMFHMSTGAVSCNVGGGVTRLPSTMPLPLGRWVHVLCAHDGTTLRLYFDGEPVGSLTAPLPAPMTTNLQIGQNCCDGSDELTGQLSDVRIWSRAPTAAELEAMVASPPP